MQPTTKPPTGQQCISLRVFAEPAPDMVSALANYESAAERGDVRSLSGLANYIVRLIEVFARMPPRRRSLDTAASFCICVGVEPLAQLPGVDAIRAAREAVQSAGADWASWYEDWPYDLDAHGSGRRRVLSVRVAGDDWALVGRLAEDLGLTRSTVAGLAIIGTLVRVPLPARQHGFMFAEIRRFRKELAARAEQARHLPASAPAAPVRASTWEEVLGDEGDE